MGNFSCVVQGGSEFCGVEGVMLMERIGEDFDEGKVVFYCFVIMEVFVVMGLLCWFSDVVSQEYLVSV